MPDKPKRARGKRVGVKLMEETYEPAVRKAFDEVIAVARNRLKLRKNSVRIHIEEELDFKDIRTRIARIINIAHAKKELARSLLKEAGDHRKKAIAIAKTIQVVPIDLDPYCDDHLESNPNSHATFGATGPNRNHYRSNGSWREDVDKLVDAAMWLQKEHLDVQEVLHWKTHYSQEIAKCITMEDCVEMIDEASAKAEELKAFIQEGDRELNVSENDGAAQPPRQPDNHTGV